MNNWIRIPEEMRNEKLEIILNDSYQFKDENGNVINATKIVLEKKKKEPTYRPFKDKDECWAEMQKHQPFGWLIRKDSNAYCYICVIFSEKAGFEEDYIYDYKYLYNNYTFADGKPFGIKED